MSINSLYKQKYRINTTRKQDHDYSSIGSYFITICTKNKYKYFGEIINGTMQLTNTGQIANKFWIEIPNHFTNVMLDEFIVMPDHIHGIIMIVHDTNRDDDSRAAINRGSTRYLQTQTNKFNLQNHNCMGKKSLGEIIRWYKGRCTFEINKQNPSIKFSWQSRYYDRIIRDNYEFFNVQKYIRNNPINWDNNKLQ